MQYGNSIARNKEEGNGIVLQDGCIGLELYCNTVYCIAIQFTVLQEKAGKAGLYRNTLRCIAIVEQGQGWTVLQYSGQPSHDTAGGR